MPITEIIQNNQGGSVITLRSNLFNDPANEKQLPVQLQLPSQVLQTFMLMLILLSRKSIFSVSPE
jgi:hypothetical protein